MVRLGGCTARFSPHPGTSRKDFLRLARRAEQINRRTVQANHGAGHWPAHYIFAGCAGGDGEPGFFLRIPKDDRRLSAGLKSEDEAVAFGFVRHKLWAWPEQLGKHGKRRNNLALRAICKHAALGPWLADRPCEARITRELFSSSPHVNGEVPHGAIGHPLRA